MRVGRCGGPIFTVFSAFFEFFNEYFVISFHIYILLVLGVILEFVYFVLSIDIL